ncbi:PREDICTED: U3 small nucleolar ribonucleoprotein protein MPP10 [Papilio xuthus]|uniref:U3 small nucleolar ribonucleoprotein protein MPP10 n=1 Tax=Papilio xuthus TaxID=66420 RepID=A0AAJ6ZL17_PAPXU|nr:PREDICTED: U3 small nucleolar ribonucleoprotein protein MPP10 [Papilio xuthus]
MEEIIDKFNVLTAKPVKYLSVQDDVKDDVKNLIKTLYDFTKSEEEGIKQKNKALPHLLVDDFDEEQIWQQVELQNSQCWDQLVWEVANCVSNKTDLTFPVAIAEKNKQNVSMDTEELSSQPKSKVTRRSKAKKQKNVQEKSKTKESIVDDDFFKLKDMEKFLLKEERDDGKKKDSDEESIDFFDDIDDGTDDEDKEKDIKYSDFFDGDEDVNDDDDDNIDDNERDDDEELLDEMYENESETEEKESPKSGDKKVRFADQPESSSSGDESETESKTNETDKSINKLDTEEKKSEFEKRQQRLQQQISKLEEKTLKEAPWQLKGEVDASKRPQNSLLEEVVDFDLTTRPPPIITEQTTITLEEIIQRRVKDKAWDDVERKEKPVDDQLVFRKPEVLDHSKSKLSLAQVYEAEYLKQKHGEPENDEENEPQEHKELREAMDKLFSKLDALCNYHYTPKPPQAEVKIISNTPAISMEEVAPVATSDAALLAPEEVKKKSKGDLVSKDERTQTDKKRERRKKKKLQRLKGNVTKVTDNRNTKKGVETNDKSIKTSKAFFQQLNDDSNSVIKLKAKRKNKGQ